MRDSVAGEQSEDMRMRQLQSKAGGGNKAARMPAAGSKTILESIVTGKRRRPDMAVGNSKVPRRSDAKRSAILRGAKQVFLTLGFERAGMDEVAARAGVSKMTVYRHFGSKEDLFAGVITDLCNRIVSEDFERIFKRAPEQALRRYAERMITIVFSPETIELHRIVIAESRRFPKLGQLFYASGPQVCIDVLARYLERNRLDPRFRMNEPQRTAEEFLELLRGYAHLRVLLKLDPVPTRRELRARVASAVAHVLPR